MKEKKQSGEEMEGGGGGDKALPNHRPSLKAHISFNNYPIWKHKLRENCFKRVREDRTRLIWKLRMPEAKDQSSNQENLIKSNLQNIVSDELRKITESFLDEKSGTPMSESSTNDMLWECDVLHTDYQCDYEEMLLEMQRIFYEDLRMEETRKEPESFIRTWEDEEDEYLAHAVYEHMQLNGEQDEEEVWCPICKQGKLKESCHHIYCSQCELKLKRGNEVNLLFLRLRLGEAHAEHLDRGCRLRPEFCIETKFHLTALYIKCQGCRTFEVVL